MIPEGMNKREANEALKRIRQEAIDHYKGVPHPGIVVEDYVKGKWAILCGTMKPEEFSPPDNPYAINPPPVVTSSVMPPKAMGMKENTAVKSVEETSKEVAEVNSPPPEAPSAPEETEDLIFGEVPTVRTRRRKGGKE